MTPSDGTRRAPLDRDAIVAAAIELADERGIGEVTMRRLAERLGFKAMALYNHVATKDELFALVVDTVAAEIGDPPEDLDPRSAVRWIAVSTRAMFVRHPWASEIWLRHLPGPRRTAQMEQLLRTLDATDLSPDLAHHGFHAVTNHVLGYTLQERAMSVDVTDADDAAARARDYLDGVPVETFPFTVAHVHQHLDGDTSSSFELVLDLILDGLVRLEQDRISRP